MKDMDALFDYRGLERKEEKNRRIKISHLVGRKKKGESQDLLFGLLKKEKRVEKWRE